VRRAVDACLSAITLLIVAARRVRGLRLDFTFCHFFYSWRSRVMAGLPGFVKKSKARTALERDIIGENYVHRER
jgi:hypothetical protein